MLNDAIEKLKSLIGSPLNKAEGDIEPEDKEPENDQGENEPEEESEDEKYSKKYMEKFMAKYMKENPEELEKMMKKMMAEFPEKEKELKKAMADLEDDIQAATATMIDGTDFMKAVVNMVDKQNELITGIASIVTGIKKDLAGTKELQKAMAKFQVEQGTFPNPVRGIQAGLNVKPLEKAISLGKSNIENLLFEKAKSGDKLAEQYATELSIGGFGRLSDGAKNYINAVVNAI